MGVRILKFSMLLLAFNAFTNNAICQLGISIEFFPERIILDNDGESTFLSRNAGLVAVTTYFRLKNHRLEFIPYAGVYGATGNYTINGAESSINSAGFAIGSKILAYPLDFLNDCNCPTFNKSGMWFKKGFFFYLDPQFLTYKFNVDSEFTAIEDNQFSNLGMSLGLGIDFGLSAGFTLTPYTGFHTQVASFSNNSFVMNTSSGSIPLETVSSRRSNPLLIGVMLQYRLSKKRY